MPRKGGHHIDQMHKRVENLAREILNMKNNGTSGSRRQSRSNSRPHSRSSSAGPPQSRGNSKGRGQRSHSHQPKARQNENRTPRESNRKESRGFAMCQMPLPEFHPSSITDARYVYQSYGQPAGTFKIEKKSFYAFQTNTVNGELPKTIVAQRLNRTKRSKDVIEQNAVKTIPYESYALDSVDNTFLLYVSTNNMVSEGAKLEDEEEEIFGVLDGENGAVAEFQKPGREYYIFYSIAYTVLSKREPGKTIPAFMTLFVPCTLQKNIADNIIHKEKLGIVKPTLITGAPAVETVVSTRTELIEKYKAYISCHSFCDECKLSASDLHSIDSKIRAVLEGTYLVKRVTESTGAVQIVHSPRIKIGARFGAPNNSQKIRNFRMSMVFQMPYKTDTQKAVIRKLCRDVMFSIVAKVKDPKYQKSIMYNPADPTANTEWTSGLAKHYMLEILRVFYECYYFRIMHHPINATRVYALSSGFFTWKQYFEERAVIPAKYVWDKMTRTRELVNQPVLPRIHVLPDESTDEENDADSKSSKYRSDSRAGSVAPERGGK